MAQSERRQLHVCTARCNNEIEITITDTGRGLPDDMVENLFEPFQTTKSTGMGLGLTICRSIVEDHGGQLVYQPNQGGGAIFLVKLPVIFDRVNEC
jgi:two-component system sensor kinase FixL